LLLKTDSNVAGDQHEVDARTFFSRILYFLSLLRQHVWYRTHCAVRNGTVSFQEESRNEVLPGM
jgi:hypothetical protein